MVTWPSPLTSTLAIYSLTVKRYPEDGVYTMSANKITLIEFARTIFRLLSVFDKNVVFD